MTKETLEEKGNMINTIYLPLTDENHDVQNPIGVLLYGEVFPLDDGEFALGFVAGVYEEAEDLKTYKLSARNTAGNMYKRHLNKDYLKEVVNLNKNTETSLKKINVRVISSLMNLFLDSTDVSHGGQLRIQKKFVASTGDLTIEIYPKDHLPDHFHVISRQRKINARFDLDTLEHISNETGQIREKDIRKIQAFLKLHPTYIDVLRSECQRMKG